MITYNCFKFPFNFNSYHPTTHMDRSAKYTVVHFKLPLSCVSWRRHRGRWKHLVWFKYICIFDKYGVKRGLFFKFQKSTIHSSISSSKVYVIYTLSGSTMTENNFRYFIPSIYVDFCTFRVNPNNDHLDQFSRATVPSERQEETGPRKGDMAKRPTENTWNSLCHYENLPMQYTEIFKVVKNENFQ